MFNRIAQFAFRLFQPSNLKAACQNLIQNRQPQFRLFSDCRQNSFLPGIKRSLPSTISGATTTYLDASNLHHPIITNEDGSSSEITSLSPTGWRHFLNNLCGKVSVTIGYRSAFLPKMPLSHCVFLVKDDDNQAIFGYQHANKQVGMFNDAKNINAKSIDGQYVFYDELTITADATHAKSLLEKIEQSAQSMRCTLATHNCYTPVIDQLLEASKRKQFDAPPQYADKLLLVTSLDQNGGLGVTTNPTLRKQVKAAIARNI